MEPGRRPDIGERIVIRIALPDYRTLESKRVGNEAVVVPLDDDLELPWY